MLEELKSCFMEAYDDNQDGKIDIREVGNTYDTFGPKISVWWGLPCRMRNVVCMDFCTRNDISFSHDGAFFAFFFKLVFKCLGRAETNKLFGDFPWRRNQLSGKVFGQKKVFFFVFSHCVEATLNEFLIEVELAAEVRTIGRGFFRFSFFYTK